MPPFRYRMPVRFSDIDHAGIVYFARFFHFAHLALEEFFLDRVGGRAYAQLIDEERIGFPAVETGCRFVAPLKFGDTAEIELEIARLGRSSIQFQFRVFRVSPEPPTTSAQPRVTTSGQSTGSDEGDDRVLCADGRYVVAVVDLDRFRATPIPDSLHAIIAPLVVASPDDSKAD